MRSLCLALPGLFVLINEAAAFLPAARVATSAVAPRGVGPSVMTSQLWKGSRHVAVRATEEEETAEKLSEEEASKPSNAVDDVFNSVPFLTRRKEAIEKELASIDDNIAELDGKYQSQDDDWGQKIASMRKDYDTMKLKYYNDTVETSVAGKSSVFIQLLSVVDDFERAKMAYKPQTDSQGEIVAAYDNFKDEIVKAMLASGMEEVKTVGEPFDFKLHDCMFTETSDEYPDEIITREFAKGFLIGGKCIRPAKVACSTGPGPN